MAAAKRMLFLGVSTGESSIARVFPAWAEILRIPGAQLTGVDIPLNAPDNQYREILSEIQQDPSIAGALVTSHKISLMQAAGDLFDETSEDARICGEVSCIYKRGGKLIAHAVDPDTCGQAMDQFLLPGYWQENETDLLCLGAGGAAVAIAVHFATRRREDEQPRRMIFVDKRITPLEHLRDVISRLPDHEMQFSLHHHEQASQNDRLLAGLPQGSLVINATGMGKDIPGSPVSDQATYPEFGFVWDLNYRGELDFMRQARSQDTKRNLKIVDGWDYFLFGWSAVMSYVFDLEIPLGTFDQLAFAAGNLR